MPMRRPTDGSIDGRLQHQQQQAGSRPGQAATAPGLHSSFLARLEAATAVSSAPPVVQEPVSTAEPPQEMPYEALTASAAMQAQPPVPKQQQASATTTEWAPQSHTQHHPAEGTGHTASPLQGKLQRVQQIVQDLEARQQQKQQQQQQQHSTSSCLKALQPQPPAEQQPPRHTRPRHVPSLATNTAGAAPSQQPGAFGGGAFTPPNSVEDRTEKDDASQRQQPGTIDTLLQQEQQVIADCSRLIEEHHKQQQQQQPSPLHQQLKQQQQLKRATSPTQHLEDHWQRLHFVHQMTQLDHHLQQKQGTPRRSSAADATQANGGAHAAAGVCNTTSAHPAAGVQFTPLRQARASAASDGGAGAANTTPPKKQQEQKQPVDDINLELQRWRPPAVSITATADCYSDGDSDGWSLQSDALRALSAAAAQQAQKHQDQVKAQMQALHLAAMEAVQGASAAAAAAAGNGSGSRCCSPKRLELQPTIFEEGTPAPGSASGESREASGRGGADPQQQQEQQPEQVVQVEQALPTSPRQQQRSSQAVSQPSSPRSPKPGWFNKSKQQQQYIQQLQEALGEQQQQLEALTCQREQQLQQLQELSASLQQQQEAHHAEQEAHRQRLTSVQQEYKQHLQTLLNQMEQVQIRHLKKAEQLQRQLLQQHSEKQEKLQLELQQEMQQRETELQEQLLTREAEHQRKIFAMQQDKLDLQAERHKLQEEKRALQHEKQRLQQHLDRESDRVRELVAQAEVRQLEADQAGVAAQQLQDQLAEAQAERSDLQLQCLHLKQKVKKLQAEQERVLESNITVQERQQHVMLQQLRQAEQEKAHKQQLQEELAKQKRQIQLKEASLLECQEQLQGAKAVLQAEVDQQHTHIRSMITQLQQQERLMIADVKAAKAQYINDLKTEGQRTQDLLQQLSTVKSKHKETTSKLKQMQRDHARLLERKLEGDRRIATLQQKLQQARKQQGGGGGAVDGGGGGQQQQAGSVPLTVEHERGARLAAEAKMGGLEEENRVLNEIVSTLRGELDPLMQALSKQQQPSQPQPQKQQFQAGGQLQPHQTSSAKGPEVQQLGGLAHRHLHLDKQHQKQQHLRGTLTEQQQQQQQQFPALPEAGVFASPVKGLCMMGGEESAAAFTDTAAQQRNAAAAAILRQQGQEPEAAMMLLLHQPQAPLLPRHQQHQQYPMLNKAPQRRQLPEFADILKPEARPPVDRPAAASHFAPLGGSDRLLPAGQLLGHSSARPLPPAGQQRSRVCGASASAGPMVVIPQGGAGAVGGGGVRGLSSSHNNPGTSLRTYGRRVGSQTGQEQGVVSGRVVAGGRSSRSHTTDEPSRMTQQKQQYEEQAAGVSARTGFDLLTEWPLPQHSRLSAADVAAIQQLQYKQNMQDDQGLQRGPKAVQDADTDSTHAQLELGAQEGAAGVAGSARGRHMPALANIKTLPTTAAATRGGLVSPSRANSPVAREGAVAPRQRGSGPITPKLASGARQAVESESGAAAAAVLPQQKQQVLVQPGEGTTDRDAGGFAPHHHQGCAGMDMGADLRGNVLQADGQGDAAGFSSPKEYSSHSVFASSTGEYSTGSFMLPSSSQHGAATAACRALSSGYGGQGAEDGSEQAVAEAAAAAAKCRTLCDALNIQLAHLVAAQDGQPEGHEAADPGGAAVDGDADAEADGDTVRFVSGRSGGKRVSRVVDSQRGSSVLYEQWSELQRQVQEVEALMLDSQEASQATLVSALSTAGQRTSMQSNSSGGLYVDCAQDGLPTTAVAAAGGTGASATARSPSAGSLITAEAMNNQALVSLAVNLIGTQMRAVKTDPGAGSNGAAPLAAPLPPQTASEAGVSRQPTGASAVGFFLPSFALKDLLPHSLRG